MEDYNFCWTEGYQGVLNPLTYRNFGWTEGATEAIEHSEGCLHLPAMATTNTADIRVAEALSVDGLPAIFSDCRSMSNNGGYAARERTNTKRSRPWPRTIEPSLKRPRSSNISFQRPSHSSLSSSSANPDPEAIAQMKEMIYHAAAFRPVSFVPDDPIQRPRRKNVRISSDPQTTAARKRRERFGERIRALQQLVPGGTNMDTASMLEEAANYLKFLKGQVKALERAGNGGHLVFSPVPFSLHSYKQCYYNLDNHE